MGYCVHFEIVQCQELLDVKGGPELVLFFGFSGWVWRPSDSSRSFEASIVCSCLRIVGCPGRSIICFVLRIKVGSLSGSIKTHHGEWKASMVGGCLRIVGFP